MPKRYLRKPILLFKNPYIVTAIVVTAITYALTWRASPEQMMNWYSTLMAVVAAWGMWKWGGVSIQAIINGDVSKPALGAVGVFLLMTHLALSRGNTVGVITWNWPTYQQSYVAAVLVLFALFGVVLFALASRTDESITPKSPRTASFITGFFSAALLIFSGAFHHLITHIGKIYRFFISMF